VRHRKAGRQLGRNSSHRRALLRSLLTSFLAHEKIETTEAKAKEFRPLAERMITLGKRGDLNARRLVLKYVSDRQVISKLFNEISPRFSSRNGGYTRIIKTRQRFGDAARMAIVEMVGQKEAEPQKKIGKKEGTN
jgi:large subunit ribosomal protein L17